MNNDASTGHAFINNTIDKLSLRVKLGVLVNLRLDLTAEDNVDKVERKTRWLLNQISENDFN